MLIGGSNSPIVHRSINIKWSDNKSVSIALHLGLRMMKFADPLRVPSVQ